MRHRFESRLSTARWLMLAALILAACSSDDGGTGDTTPDVSGADSADGAVDDTGDPDVEPDGADDAGIDVADAAPDADATGMLGGYGEPCESNRDCESGYCVPSQFGFLCTVACTDDCPPLDDTEFSCEPVVNAGGDAIDVCLPSGDPICTPCLDDVNCPGGACVTLGRSQVCGLDCADQDDCPLGTACIGQIGGEPLAVRQCLPQSLTCDCNEENEGETRPCARSSVDGTLSCTGVEICDPLFGWSDCDAPLPEPERCDGIDNDCNGVADDGLSLGGSCEVSNEFGTCPGIELCDGVGVVCQGQEPAEEACDYRDNDCDGAIDETFRDDDGRLLQDEHCGACGNNCGERYPEGWVSSCQLLDGEPACVIDACPPGYAPAGPLACVPLDSALCQSCTTDADCNAAVGDRCLLDGPTGFCGRDCGADSVFGESCPDGYVCDPDETQCVRETGTCGCEAGDLFSLPCGIEGPDGSVCAGRQLCDDGAVGVCEPPAEQCNGVDDNCDGVIDEPFVDGAGRYVSDAHCGRCFNDCDLLYAGAPGVLEGTCFDGADEPFCVATCAEGVGDADGLSFNGCECTILSETDEPDPAGVDANCDGIDGEIARGVFVSRAGDDVAGDGSITAPFATIGRAMEVARPGLRDQVFVAAGVYGESVTLTDGVSLYGGYGFDFRTRDLVGNETAIVGQAPTASAPGALTVRDVTAPVVVSGFTIVGADRVEPGASSYAVYLRNADNRFTLRNSRVRGGRGAAGDAGDAGGTGATAAPGVPGFTPPNAGAGAVDSGGFCPSPPTPQLGGGAGARFTCEGPLGNPVATDGGAGGSSFCPDPDAQNGAGVAGSGTPTPGGGTVAGGGGGSGGTHLRHWSSNPQSPPVAACNLCIVPGGPTDTIEGQPGLDGDRGADGTAGAGCGTTPGIVIDGLWQAGSGAGMGGRGAPGSGGGGGGAGGGVGHCTRGDCALTSDRICTANDVLGGSGGGGGAGGCGGEGGQPGFAGGGSFGVFVVFDAAPAGLPVLTDNVIERGVGGAGGAGGPGGEGGTGSEGAPGTNSGLGCPGQGGAGGAGGPGGPGGGGGGGCAGPSVAVWVGGAGGLSTADVAASNLFPDTGVPGTPGQGGPSPGADGAAAADALYEAVLPCAGGEEAPCR